MHTDFRETFPDKLIENGIELFYEDAINQILKEAFRKPSFEQIEEFVNDMFDNELSLSDLLFKYRIDIEFVPKKQKHDRTVIYSASYDQINNVLIIKVRDTIGDYPEDRDDFLKNLKDFYVHEDTHAQQNIGKHKFQQYYDGPDLNKYVSQFQEIPAFAREVAYVIKSRLGLEVNDAIKLITNGTEKELIQLPIKDVAVIKQYRVADKKVLKKFLKEVYRFYRPFEDDRNSTIDYRQWLKDHQNDA
jgi:hypothetical protein